MTHATTQEGKMRKYLCLILLFVIGCTRQTEIEQGIEKKSEDVRICTYLLKEGSVKNTYSAYLYSPGNEPARAKQIDIPCVNPGYEYALIENIIDYCRHHHHIKILHIMIQTYSCDYWVVFP